MSFVTACGNKRGYRDENGSGTQAVTQADDKANAGDPTNTTPGSDALSGCGSDADCTGESFCHFEDLTSFSTGTRGECQPACARDNDCSLGQTCVSGRCYSNIACDPAQGGRDCPPGEICNAQMRLCSAPPSRCQFNEQCPRDYICDIDGICRDPSAMRVGPCAQTSDCNSLDACERNSCVCQDGTCVGRPCQNSSACDRGTGCIDGVCRPLHECSETSDCAPYGMICKNGFCDSPNPCGPNNSCPNGFVCHDNRNPPACMPAGTNQCSRDEQCRTGQYCNLFSGQCELGCRNNADCTGQCGPGNDPCVCSNNRSCVKQGTQPGGGGGNPGGTPVSGRACDSQTECPAGSACAPDDPTNTFCGFDDLFGGGSLCAKSCHQVCDLLTNLITDTCPSGQRCEAPADAMMDWLGGIFGGGSSGAPQSQSTGFCY